jgi:hypothetical protein
MAMAPSSPPRKKSAYARGPSVMSGAAPTGRTIVAAMMAMPTIEASTIVESARRIMRHTTGTPPSVRPMKSAYMTQR